MEEELKMKDQCQDERVKGVSIKKEIYFEETYFESK